MSAEEKNSVVLVHGLWLHGAVFFALRRRLTRQGFAVHAFSYPSVRGGLYENARSLADCVQRLAGDSIFLVGHSLGGLVILSMLERFPDARVKRAVLMGSPYGGSHCAGVLLRSPLAPIIGRSLVDWLAIDPARRLDPARQPVDLGILAGDKGVGLGRLLGGLPHPNDGVVALAETQIAGCRDAITLPVAHSQMPFSRACAEQVASFLKTGSFLRA